MSTAKAFPAPSHPFPKEGEPTWDLALMYPLQGGWSVDEYLRLDTGLLVEYDDGFVRVLPMPTLLHQWIVKFLFEALNEYVRRHQLGEVFFAPLPVRMTPSKYREPDIVFLRPERMPRMDRPPDGADLVMEVVSEGKEARDRDYVEKRVIYGETGVSEYWIVDPEERKITVLALEGNEYCEDGVYDTGDQATSRLLDGFDVNVSATFAKCQEKDMGESQ